MSDRIAHRPRYRSLYYSGQIHLDARQRYFFSRWSYRQQRSSYTAHPLGYSLSRLPLPPYPIL